MNKLAREIIDAVINGLKQKLIIMPKFVEKVFFDYKLVPKNVEYEVPVPVKKEKPYEVPVPVLKEVPREVIVEKVKTVEKVKEVPVPQLKYYNIESFKPSDVVRMKEMVELFPKIKAMLEEIVKFKPKEVPYEVKVPKVKEVPYPVDVPEYKPTVVLKPHFQDVKVLHPVIVEQIMTLEEWNSKTKEEREKIGEIVKSQLKMKERR